MNVMAEEGATGGLRIQILGEFAVSVGSRALPEAQWKSRRASRLVTLLALAPAHRLHRDQVIDSLWPESNLSAAANNCHQALHGARRILDSLAPGCLRLEDGVLSLQALGGKEQALVVDIQQFESAAVTARVCQAPEEYQAALAFYRGDLLPEDLYEEFTFARREALRQLFVNLLLELAVLYERRWEYTKGIDTLQRLLQADRSHEQAHTGLMRLYAASGQRQQALRQFQALRDTMKEELDAEPGPQPTALYQDNLSGEYSPAAVSTQPKPTAHGAAGPAPEETAAREAIAPNNLPAQLTSFIGREAEMARAGRRPGSGGNRRPAG